MSKRLAVILGIGGALRLGWVCYSTAVPSSDAAGYRALALSLASGQGYSVGGHPTAWWVPGWPAWMAWQYWVFGTHDWVIYASNILLGVLTILLTYLLGKRLASEGTALLAAALIACSPSLLMLPRFLLTENLAVPGTALLALLGLRSAQNSQPARTTFLVGILAGLLILVREQTDVLLPAFLVLWLLSRLSLVEIALRSAAMAIGVALIVTPWVMRNEAALGLPWLDTTAGINVYVAFNPAYHGMWVNPDVSGWTWPGSKSSEAGIYDYGKAKGMRFLANNPKYILAIAPFRLLESVTDEGWVATWNAGADGQRLQPIVTTLLQKLGNIWWLTILVTVGAFITRLPIRDGRFAFLLVIAITTFGMTAFLYEISRIHAPVEPLMVVLASYLLSDVALRRHNQSGLSRATRY